MTEGVSQFRVGIKLKSGQLIHSTPQSVFYVPPENICNCPTRVTRGGNISIYTLPPGGEIFSLFDFTGKKIYMNKIQSTKEDINTPRLSVDFYFYRITKGGKNVATRKIIIVN